MVNAVKRNLVVGISVFFKCFFIQYVLQLIHNVFSPQ